MFEGLRAMVPAVGRHWPWNNVIGLWPISLRGPSTHL